jgi:hypothetical protein
MIGNFSEHFPSVTVIQIVIFIGVNFFYKLVYH